MLEKTVANRYCFALIALAEQAGNLRVITEELRKVSDYLTEDSTIKNFFSSPFYNYKEKGKILEDFLVKLQLSSLSSNFFRLLLRNSRISDFGFIYKAFITCLDKKANKIHASLFSSAKMENEKVEKIASKLKELCNKEIEFQTTEEADLIGGFKIIVNNTIIDCSVKNQLKELKETVIKRSL